MARLGPPELPAPPVTVVDPAHPRPLVPWPEPPRRQGLRRREGTLVVALCVLLLWGWTSSARLRAEQRRERVLDDVRLSATTIRGSSISMDGRVLRVLVV